MRKVVNLSIRVPGTLDRLVARRAVRDGVTKSEVIRIALTRFFAEQQTIAGDPGKDTDLQEKTPTEKGAPPRKGTA